MTTELEYLKIKKLSVSSNYDSWARVMEMYLVDLDMWNFVKTEMAATATPVEQKLAARARAKLCLLLEDGSCGMLNGTRDMGKATNRLPAKMSYSI